MAAKKNGKAAKTVPVVEKEIVPSAPVERSVSAEELKEEQLRALSAKVRAAQRGEYVLTQEERENYERFEAERHAKWLALHGASAPAAALVAPPAPILVQKADDGKSVVAQLPENLRWKLAFLDERKNRMLQEITLPIRQKYEQGLRQEMDEALKSNANYVAVVNEMNKATNEVLETVERHLPPDYAINNINFEQGYAQAVENPKARGARMPVI